MRFTRYLLSLLVGVALVSQLSAAEATDDTLVVVVMDPLSAPLSCPCVEGYAQRDYTKLAKFLEQRLGRPCQLVFHESLAIALKEKAKGQADLIIGKDSVVRFDAAKLKVNISPIARLTSKEGLTTQTGLIIVRSADPAQSLSDLTDYRLLLGPEDSDEKHSAAKQLLTNAGLDLPADIETSAACSDGACKIIEWGDEVRAATVISSYAKPLLEGCGTISKGDLRVLGETKPVPFVTAFVRSDLPETLQTRLRKTLLEVADSAELRRALESMHGFVPLTKEELAKEELAAERELATAKKKSVAASLVPN